MNAHTKAPWNATGYNVHTTGTVAFCQTNSSGFDGTASADEMRANARLIAAAPDMLDELQKQLTWLKHIQPQVEAPSSVMLGFEQSIKCLNAVIEKASGS